MRASAPIDAQAFGTFLELLIATAGPGLLRVKGLVKIAEQPAYPLVLHAVQHVLHEPVLLDGWPSADQDTRLVFIVRGIEADIVTSLFTVLTGGQGRTVSTATGREELPDDGQQYGEVSIVPAVRCSG